MRALLLAQAKSIYKNDYLRENASIFYQIPVLKNLILYGNEIYQDQSGEFICGYWGLSEQVNVSFLEIESVSCYTTLRYSGYQNNSNLLIPACIISSEFKTTASLYLVRLIA